LSVCVCVCVCERGWIIIRTKHPSDKRRNDYFINPVAAWRGNSYARKKIMSRIDPSQLLLFGEKPKEDAITETRDKTIID